ncbi:glutamate receptor ionotropic, kainate 4-like isoform X1 [Varroa jacobsoni]|uniref:glutamate receptor ionotropic, kainate 4-like isoform X1 n=1 Tax=Varroa jacobsoni TaxID=62625 RepID=UPI000BF3A197|nr:glutamate receptor ionotropic, kainate 4-like isoform X1 [Varroa jacobsoni]XP_022686979.1 glutamate receptor ionotropic, kainate 4-like isoform X1 [Varroa jacobsoni]
MSSEITVVPVNVAWIDQRHCHDISLQMRTFYQSYSVVMARNNPFYFPLSTYKESYGGVDTALVQALSQSLQANFTISMSPVRSWGSCGSRGNCSGMLGMLQRNEFDIALSGMSLSYERYRVIDFSFPYLVDRITFAVRPPQLLDPADAIIRPFSPEVWLYLAATIGVSLIVRCASLRLPEKFHGFVSLLEIHGLLLGKGCRWVPSLVSQRLLFCLWLMLSLVLSASYSGKLFSSMTHPGLENIIDTIDELANALKKGTIVCGTIRGTDFEKALQQEHPLSPVNQLILHSLISDDNAVGNDAEGLQVLKP